MARPARINESEILKAAQELFLKHGFRASTAQIARRAGVAEGSIYRHFKTKVELFLSAMDMREKNTGWQDRLRQYDPERDDVRTLLEEAAHGLLQHFNRMLPKFMALRASGLSPEDLGKVFKEPPPLVHLRILTVFFKQAAARGLIRARHPAIQAQSFQGALLHFAMCKHRFGFMPHTPDVYVNELLDLYLAQSADPVVAHKEAA